MKTILVPLCFVLAFGMILAACGSPPEMLPPASQTPVSSALATVPMVTESPAGTSVPAAGTVPSQFSDPFVYCAAIGTLDSPDARYVGPAAPETVIAELRKKAGIAPDAPADWVAAGTVWRCMDGKVWACFVGANLPCAEKANTSSTPPPELNNFCQANPQAESIPADVTGRATIYDWRCKDGAPQVVKQLFTPDARGFLTDFWYELSAP